MLKLIKLEFRKMLKIRSYIVPIIVGCIIIILQSINFYNNSYLGDLSNYNMAMEGGKYSGMIYPTVLIQGWIGGDYASVFLQLFYTILPILAVIPYGTSFYTEYRRGYLKNIYTRVNRFKYLSAKYIVAFISGGVVGAFPLILSWIICSMYLPNLPQNPLMLQTAIMNTSMWKEFYYNVPFIYAMLYTLLTFIYSGIFGVLAICVSTISKNIFIASLFPFLLNIFSYYLLRGTYNLISYVPHAFLIPTQIYISTPAKVFGVFGVMLVCTFIISTFGLSKQKIV